MRQKDKIIKDKSKEKATIPTGTTVRNLLVPILERYAVKEGVTNTPWPGLVIGRCHRPMPRFLLTYVPSLCVVAQGRKHVYLGHNCIIYDPLNYLVVTLPMPLEAEIVVASEEQPFLALSLEIDMSSVGKLLLEMTEEHRYVMTAQPMQAIYASAMNDDLLNAIARLLRAIESPETRRILGPGAATEIFYHILRGEQGTFLRALALRDSGSQRIARIVHHLQNNYTQPLDISSIANVAGMGKSTLHHTFEKFVGQSPIQYLKKIRLNQARLMMVSNGLNASEAAYQVGYNSASQFSREFKRQFGLPPSQAVKNL